MWDEGLRQVKVGAYFFILRPYPEDEVNILLWELYCADHAYYQNPIDSMLEKRTVSALTPRTDPKREHSAVHSHCAGGTAEVSERG